MRPFIARRAAHDARGPHRRGGTRTPQSIDWIVERMQQDNFTNVYTEPVQVCGGRPRAAVRARLGRRGSRPRAACNLARGGRPPPGSQVPHWVRGNEYATMLTPRVIDLPMLSLGMSIGTRDRVHGARMRSRRHRQCLTGPGVETVSEDRQRRHARGGDHCGRHGREQL